MQYSDVGNRNLEVVERQSKFTDWMHSEIQPYIKGHILEVGSGMGTYSAYFLKQDPKAVFSDVDAQYVKTLKRRFPKNDAYLLDISNTKHIDAIRKKQKFDTIIFLNVLEHVEHDTVALQLLRTLLRPGGRIICLVPTHRFLYNAIDASIGHFRRYTKKELKAKVLAQGYVVERLFSFNVFAIPGWFVNGTLFKQQAVNPAAMSLFNTLVPIFKFIERYVLFHSVGISTIIVAANPAKKR